MGKHDDAVLKKLTNRETLRKTFVYQGRDGRGIRIDGRVAASSEAAAVDVLAGRGIVPFFIQPETEVSGEDKGAGDRLSRGLFKKKTRQGFFPCFSLGESAGVFRYLADMVQAGVDVPTALRQVAAHGSRGRKQEALRAVERWVRDGVPLSQAMEKIPGLCPALTRPLLAAGERTGKLGMMLEQAAASLEHQESLRQEWQTQLLYPSLVLFLGIITVFIMMTRVVPSVTAVFEDSGMTLPLVTRVVLSVSRGCVQYGLGTLMVIGVLGFGIIRVIQGDREVRENIEKGCLKIPLWGDWIRNGILSRAWTAVGVQLQSGVSPVEALRACGTAMPLMCFQKVFFTMADEVRDGSALSAAIRRHSVFPEGISGLVELGEQTGRLGECLTRAALSAQRSAERAGRRISVLLEPLCLLGLGGLIGLIALALLWPILKMNTMVM